jgi:hypothetical protein
MRPDKAKESLGEKLSGWAILSMSSFTLLDVQSFLPRLAIIDTAEDHDNKRAQEVCAGIRAGEIVLFGKAYVWFVHLLQLTQRGVFWVTRAKDNLDWMALLTNFDV